MSAANTLQAELSDEDQKKLEWLLIEFDRQWHAGLLAEYSNRLDRSSPLGNRARVEMVKIDLERQRNLGRAPTLDSYLAVFPELGTPDTAPAELIHAEFQVRRQFGEPADLDEYCRRFPIQAAELRRLAEAARLVVSDTELSAIDTSTVSFPRSPAETPRGAAVHEAATQAPGQAAESPMRGTAAADWSVRQLPEKFGRYRILRCLGRGGMGAVYLAHDTELDRQVAMKTPHFDSDAGPEVLERFIRECRAAATLDHPNICPVYDVGRIDGIHYLVMAYIDGNPLSEFAKPDNPIPPRQVAEIVRKLALALQDAHDRGVVHRDLKPANIMVNKRRELVIMDFGLARIAKKAGEAESRLTQSGAVMGTPAYMSPEQVMGDVPKIGPATDIYSLGVIMYELLTGRLPFRGVMTAVLAQIVVDEPPRPSSIRSGIDPALETICLKAMAKKLDSRYGSMLDLAAALGEYLASNERVATSESAVGWVESSRATDLKSEKSDPKSPMVGLEDSTHPTPTSVAPAASQTGDRRPLVKRIAAVAAVLLIAALGLGAFEVYRIQTDYGTLVVEINDDTIEAKLKQRGVVVHDPSTGRTFTVRAEGTNDVRTGNYRQVEPGKYPNEKSDDLKLVVLDDSGLDVATNEFKLTRGGKVRVRVVLEPTEPALGPSGDRLVGTWVGTSETELPGFTFTVDYSVEFKRSGRVDWKAAPRDITGMPDWAKQKFFESAADNRNAGNWRVDQIVGDTLVVHVVNDFEPDKTIGWRVTLDTTDSMTIANFEDSASVKLVRKQPAGPVATTTPPVMTGLTEQESITLGLVNAERSKADAAALRPNLVLCKVARRHAAAMATAKKLRHELNEKSPFDRVREAGYNFAMLGENIAEGQQNPAEAIKIWMQSAGHRGNLLGKAYTEIGIGIATSEDGAMYFELIFATPASKPEPLAGPERRAAEVMIKFGSAAVLVDGQRREINQNGELPADGFQLVTLNVGSNSQITDADLEVLSELSSLQKLVLTDASRVTDIGVAHLSGLTGLEVLSLQNTQVSDAGLQHILGMTKLRELMVGGTQVSDNGVERLRELPKLITLDLGRTRVTDVSIDHLKHLPELRRLLLYDNKITDVGLEKLKALTHLTTLILTDTQVTGAGLAHLAELGELEELILDRANLAGASLDWISKLTRLRKLLLERSDVTDAELASLKPLTNLAFLNFAHTRISDTGLEQLKGLTELRLLNLSGTRVTDAGLDQLVGLTKLEELVIDQTKITTRGVQRLREALPKCKITPEASVPVPESFGGIADRRATEWLIKNGGGAAINVGGKDGGFAKIDQLPAEPFFIVYIEATGCRTALTDDVLIELAPGLTRLQRINGNFTKFTGTGFAAFRESRLDALDLNEGSITDAGLEAICNIPTIGELAFPKNHITDAGLKHLPKLRELWNLDLRGNKVTDAGAAELAKCSNLRDLGLDETGITDAGLQDLMALSHLGGLHVQKTNVTVEGVKKLHDALPKCQIFSDYGTFDPKN